MKRHIWPAKIGIPVLLLGWWTGIWAQEGVFREATLEEVGIHDSLYYNPEAGVVLRLSVFRGVVLDTLEIIPEDQFEADRIQESIRDLIREVFSESLRIASERTGQGLIPDIEIPVKIPGGMGFIGQGGKLKIEGKQDLSLGLQDTRILGLPQYEGPSRSGIPELKMDQHLVVRLTGTVGQRIKVLVDHDSKRENKLKNKIKLTYEGDEDDILKLIETGDTDYSVRGAQNLGFSQRGKKGLFGVKLEGQLGPVNFTAVATREQAQGEKRTIRPNAETRVDTIYARDYQAFQFVWLGDTARIVALEVFVDDNNNYNNQNAIYGYAQFYDLNAHEPNPVYQEEGYFQYLLPDQDYIFYQIVGSNVLQLKRPLRDQQEILCVRYITASGDTVGNFGDTTIVYGKILKPRSFDDSLYVFNPVRPLPSDSVAYRYYARNILWNLWFKNIYSLRTQEIPSTGLRLVIRKQGPGIDRDGENGHTYLNILGIDSNNDGYVDFQQYGTGATILDRENGLLIFPSLYPFASADLSDPDSIIYMKPRRLMDPNEGTKYYMEIQSSSRLDVIVLGAMNIVEGSEVVTYNGRQLERGRDYTIDYQTGIINIINPEIKNDPNASIEVTFDYSPFFSLKQRSLFAARLESNWSDNVNIGMGWLLRTESTLDRRPQLGSEPSRLLFGELDWSIQQEVPWITRFLDWLPLISADQNSSIQFRGAIKRNFPTINTIGAAYLDDMESNDKTIDISIAREKWIYGSIPSSQGAEVYDTTNYAKRVIWASPQDLVKYIDVYPNAPEERRDDFLQVMMWIVEPLDPAPPNSWASLNQLLDFSGMDISKYDFLEVYVKGDGMKLHIDIGKKIPERSVWRDKQFRIRGITDYTLQITPTGDTIQIPVIHNEDRNGDGTLDVGEDTGLDLVAGDDDQWSPSSGDDGNDDYRYNPQHPRDYSHINGTEGNGKLDSEDLDANGVLETENLYFEYTIDLDDPTYTALVYENPQSGWKYYRIPLKNPDFYTLFGDQAVWENVKFVRIWVSGFTRTDTLMIAQIKITGNQWLSKGVHSADSLSPVTPEEKFGIASVNNEETPDYTPPPGVRLYRDPATQRLERERSLALVATNIKPGHYGLAQKDLAQKLDFLDYRVLKLWVRPKPGQSPPYPTLLIRFGSDTFHYYEYRYKIRSPDWQEVTIPLDSLTQFKFSVLETLQTPPQRVISRGPFAFKGQPSLASIRMYQLGIRNDLGVPLNFEVWVDEMRLVDPRSEGGMAFETDLNANLSDVSNLNLHIERRSSNFQNSNETTRSREQRTVFNFNTQTNLHRLFPKSWGITLPVTYQRQFQQQLPVFGTGSDVVLTPEQRLRESSTMWSEQFSVSFRKTGSRNPILKALVDPIDTRFDRRLTYTSNPLRKVRTKNTQFRFSYSYRPNLPPLRLLGQEFRYFLSSISLSANYNDQYTFDSSRVASSFSLDHRKYYTFRGDFGMEPIRNLSLHYSQNVTNDKLYRPDLRFGKEIGRSENLSVNYSFSFFGLVNPSLTYTAQYSEERPREIQFLEDLEVRNIEGSKTASVNLNIDPLRFLSRFFPPSRIPTARVPQRSPSDTTKPSGPSFRQRIGSVIQALQRIFGAHSITLSYNQNARIFNALARPELPYRLGFQFEPLVPYLDTTRTVRTETYSLSHQTNFNLWIFGLSSSAEYSRTLNYTQQRDYYTENITFPNLNLSLSGLQQRLKFLQKFVNSASASVNYSVTQTQEADLGGSPLSKGENFSLRPNMNLQWKNGMTMTISGNLTRNFSQSLQYNTGRTETNTKSFDVSLTHSLRNPKGFTLPFLRRVLFKFKSQLNNRLTFRIEDSRSVNLGVVQTDQFKVVLDLNSSYEFTKSVTGGLTFHFANIRDRKTGRTTREWSLNANASFQF